MKTEMMAFVFEVQESKCKENGFRFNETMVQAMLSGLSVVYTELFECSVANHVAIWALGKNADLLIATFQYYQAHLKKVQLFIGNEAAQFSDDVVMGRCSNDCSMLRKLDSFNYAYEVSRTVDSLGSCLLLMLNEDKGKMITSPFIKGAQYSWNYAPDRRDNHACFISKTTEVKSRNLFYRFNMN